MPSITDAELASRAGTTVEVVRRLINLEILPPYDAEEGYEESLIPRTRLALHLEESGISHDDLRQAIAAGNAFSEIGPASLKGVPDPVVVYSASTQ